MNDGTREDGVSAPPGQPVPPACPARRPAPQSLLPGGTRLSAELEKLETEVRAGDAGWLWRPTVRYCSFTDSRERMSWREDAGKTTPGRRGPLPPTLLVIFHPL